MRRFEPNDDVALIESERIDHGGTGDGEERGHAVGLVSRYEQPGSLRLVSEDRLGHELPHAALLLTLRSHHLHGMRGVKQTFGREP